LALTWEAGAGAVLVAALEDDVAASRLDEATADTLPEGALAAA